MGYTRLLRYSVRQGPQPAKKVRGRWDKKIVTCYCCVNNWKSYWRYQNDFENFGEVAIPWFVPSSPWLRPWCDAWMNSTKSSFLISHGPALRARGHRLRSTVEWSEHCVIPTFGLLRSEISAFRTWAREVRSSNGTWCSKLNTKTAVSFRLVVNIGSSACRVLQQLSLNDAVGCDIIKE